MRVYWDIMGYHEVYPLVLKHGGPRAAGKSVFFLGGVHSWENQRTKWTIF